MSNAVASHKVRSPLSLANATRLVQVAESLGVFVLLVIVVTTASIVAPGFFTYTNLTNTLIAASITAVTGLGMTFAIAMGVFVVEWWFVRVLESFWVTPRLSVRGPPLAILGAVLTGSAIGLLNGVL